MQVKAIIVDDEKHGRENLSGLLNQYCPEVNILGEAASVQSGIQQIQKHKPQLVFLDIEMPGENGFQLLENFQEASFEVIFVTAYNNYAIKAIRFSAADYILKPINYIELKKAVANVVKRIEEKQENLRIKNLYLNMCNPSEAKIGLPNSNRIEFVDTNLIIRCEGDGNYSKVHFKDKKPLLIAKTLVELEDLLTEFSFVRVHKSHLINSNHIVAVLKNNGVLLQLSNGIKIPVSRRRKTQVLHFLNLP